MSVPSTPSDYGFRLRKGERVVATFDYVDAEGRILYRKHRIEPGQDGRSKTFLCDHPGREHEWDMGMGDKRVPYRLPDLLRAGKGQAIYMAEGEAKADKLAKWDLTATTFKDWRPEYAGLVRGRVVNILRDNDEPGRRQAEQAYNVLLDSGAFPKIVDLPGLPDGGDIIDWKGSYSDFMNVVMNVAGTDMESANASAPSAGPGEFEFVHASELRYIRPEFLIDGILETDTLSLGFGAPGSAKSFLVVDMALSVATGTDFHKRAAKKGLVFYIAGEGHNGLGRRFKAWCRRRGVSLDDALCFVSKRSAQFLDETSAKAVTEAIARLASRHGTPVLIVIDTLARNFGPGDENSNTEMGKFVAVIDGMRARFPGCTVLIVHHCGHSAKERSRGATALLGALDCEYRVEKVKDLVTLVNTKMKDAPQPPPLSFRLEDVDIGNGATSAVLVETEAPSPTANVSPMHKLARETYIRAAVEGNSWTDGENAGLHVNEWRERFNAKHTADSDAAKRQAFSRAKRDLLSEGVISVENDIYIWLDPEVVDAINLQRNLQFANKEETAR